MLFSRITKMLSSWGAPSARSAAGLTEATFRQLAESSGDVILRMRGDGRPRYVSPSCKTVLGWSAEELIGQGPEAVVLAEDLHVFFDAAAAVLSGREEGKVGAFRYRHKDGRILWGESNMRLLRGQGTGPSDDLVIVMRDITERKMLEEKLALMALTDGLTGLVNRRGFDERFDEAWRATLRNGAQMSLLLMDIDHFKGFNDHYGHQVGDDALRAVAAALAGAFSGETCTLARYGGEELTLILPELGAAAAGAMAERARHIVEALQIPHAANPAGGNVVTISVGAATALARAGATARMPEGLLAAADVALYKAKHNGRNRVETSLLLASDTSTSVP